MRALAPLHHPPPRFTHKSLSHTRTQNTPAQHPHSGKKLPPVFVPIASTPTFDTVISSRIWWPWYNMLPITIKIVVGEDAVDFGLHLTGTDNQASKPFLVMAEMEREREGFLEIGKENERGMMRRRRWRGKKGSERWVGKESVVYKNAEGGLRILLSVNNIESQSPLSGGFLSQWSHVTQLLHCKQLMPTSIIISESMLMFCGHVIMSSNCLWQTQ